MVSENDCEEFLIELMRHVGEMIATYESDNNIMLVFDTEVDVAYDRTLTFKIQQNKVEE